MQNFLELHALPFRNVGVMTVKYHSQMVHPTANVWLKS